MKNVVIFGSTGSIGINALKVIKALKDKFRVIGLSANTNTALLKEQIDEFEPEIAVICDTEKSAGFKVKKTRMFTGEDGLLELASYKNADIVVMAMSTSCALKPLLSAIDAKKRIALANKESLVMAGEIITEKAKLNGVSIIPIDSEHSAIFQCINGQDIKYLKNIYLTGTGGPLRKMAVSKMRLVPPQVAVKHPKWAMGKKISVDSATMMNKGLEVIEARWLFGLPVEKIKILIHPQAIVHSMVEFVDGSVIAQMGVTDMRLPIQYALTYPERVDSGLASLDFVDIKRLNFFKPNFKKFPSLEMAYQAGRQSGTMPCVLNAANEELVKLYLEGKIRLTDIAKGVKKIMKAHKPVKNPGLDEIFKTDLWARERVNACYQQ